LKNIEEGIYPDPLHQNIKDFSRRK
jgi:hypothetical protein